MSGGPNLLADLVRRTFDAGGPNPLVHRDVPSSSVSDSLEADSASDSTQHITDAGQGSCDGCQDDVTADCHDAACPPMPPGDRINVNINKLIQLILICSY